MDTTFDELEPAVRAIQAGACEHCGAPLEPTDKFCGVCGGEQPVLAETVPEARRKRFQCKNCGADVSLEADQRSYVCAFCGSTYVVEFSPDETGRQEPEFVIGFAVTLEEAQETFRKWLADTGWFHPGDLKQAKVVKQLRGVYLPFWSFSMLAESGWSARIGEYWYTTETYTTRVNGKTVTKTRRVRHTEWWSLGGRHHEYHSGYLISGSRGLPHEEAERIKPFHLAGLKRYAPYFLAGWLSEEYSIDRNTALERCKSEFLRREYQLCAAHMPGDTHSDLQVSTEFSDINSDLILLPIYLLTYRYKDRTYRFMLNGQTGKTAGDKPLSPVRIGIAVGVVIAVLAIIALLFFLL